MKVRVILTHYGSGTYECRISNDPIRDSYERSLEMDAEEYRRLIGVLMIQEQAMMNLEFYWANAAQAPKEEQPTVEHVAE